jgi:tRNA A37 threonylcarbamoyladenosine dehydratase
MSMQVGVFGCRNVQFFGDAGQLKVHRAFVVVVGLGGVGSHAAAMLLRSGVGKLRLIDFDQVPLWLCAAPDSPV